MSGIPAWAVRKAKVVCIERDGWNDMRNKVTDEADLMSYPQFGETYTIREVRVRFVPEWGEVLVGVLLHEVSNPIAEGGSAFGEEPGFDVRGFRPVVSKAAEQDIAEHFSDLLSAKAPQGADA